MRLKKRDSSLLPRLAWPHVTSLLGGSAVAASAVASVWGWLMGEKTVMKMASKSVMANERK